MSFNSGMCTRITSTTINDAVDHSQLVSHHSYVHRYAHLYVCSSICMFIDIDRRDMANSSA